MIFSAQQIFSDDQNLTASGVSTNIIDLGPTGTVLGNSVALVRDIGKGNPIEIVIQLTADSSGTSPTLTAVLEADDNAGFASAKEVASSVTLSDGVAGDRLSINYVPQGADERFIRINYTLAGTSPDYTVTAGVVCGAQTNA